MRRKFPHSNRTYVMGILNITPDSFYDGGRFFNIKKAVKRALEMEREGADIVDVGGESTRPGSADIGTAEELGRVIPVIRALSKRIKSLISIDTRKAAVADAALKAGASIVNDVSALRSDAAMAGIIARHNAHVVLMHMKGTPKDMQIGPAYKDLIKDIAASLRESISLAKKAGVAADRIIIDPGICFGKTSEHNLQILRRLKDFSRMGYPVCVGASRKSFIGKITGCDDPEDRIAGSLAAAVIAVLNGAKIIRAHDIALTRQAVSVADSVIGKRDKLRCSSYHTSR